VVTVSTSRARQSGKVSDESGDLAQALIEKHGGRVSGRALIPDDLDFLRRTLRRSLADKLVDVVVFTGGTGVSTTDVTIEAVRPFFEKEIEGFGEIFRSISYKKVGSAAALSRATAGIAKKKVVLCIPGSPDAVRTALEMFLGEIPHVFSLANGR